jgi:methyltransferase (TIGR00027 family)
MEHNKASLTALYAAWIRAKHYHTEDGTRIFEDAVAHHLITTSENEFLQAVYIGTVKEFFSDMAASSPDDQTLMKNAMQESPTIAEILSRARYAEDQLAESVVRGIRQYVIIGAGLDTFVFRRPDLLHNLSVFEVDHPATQSFKRQRLSEMGLVLPPHVHFVAANLTEVSLATALTTSPFRQDVPAFFSWLGTVMYISHDKVLEAFQALRSIATAGSHLVFDYFDPDAFDPDRATPRVQTLVEVVRQRGEPFLSSFAPHELETVLYRMGFRIREHLGPSEIGRKYFQGRTDGYRACEHAHFMHAVVE